MWLFEIYKNRQYLGIELSEIQEICRKEKVKLPLLQAPTNQFS